MKRTAMALAACLVTLASSAGAEDAKPWVTVGVGAGVAAIGITSFVGAIKAHDDAQSEALAKGCTTSPTVVCPAGVDATSLKTNVDGEHAMNVIGVVLTATGGVAILGGLLWHFLEHDRASSKSAAITIAPTLGGVVLSGQF